MDANEEHIQLEKTQHEEIQLEEARRQISRILEQLENQEMPKILLPTYIIQL